MKKALLAYNPMSGNRFVSKHLDSIIEKFQSLGVILEVYRIPMDDTELKKIITDDYSFIIGAGGDGTLGQVVQIMLANKVDIPLFALGAGTCNNFTRNIDVSKSLNSESQVNQIIEDVYNGKICKIDVGLVNNENIFLTSLAGGAFTDTSFSTDKNLKLMMGPLAYYLKPFTELSSIRAYAIEAIVDGKKYSENVYMFLLINGKSVGNFSNFVDTANISDGIMELILIKESSTKDIANLFFSVMKGEDITRHSNVMLLKGNEFLISADEGMKVSIDGEKGPDMPLFVEVKKEAVKVLVSKNYTE
ncbi:MAG: YegS/Rv2252/BmrU family lipid kinase [Proteocatella sp.]